MASSGIQRRLTPVWLNAGVPAPQVAEWAGPSVHVLMKVYAKCIDGGEVAARRRTEPALAIEDDPEADVVAQAVDQDE